MPRNHWDRYGRRMPTTAVFDLPITKASAWIFNCYVIESGETLVVVDPGLPVVAHVAMDHIEKTLDRSVSDIASINCTHAHPDHVGGVSSITNRAPVPVHLPHRCEAYLAGERPRNFPLVESSLRFMPMWGSQPFERDAFLEFAKLGKKIGFGGPKDIVLDFEPAGFASDGDPMPGADGWEAIHAPGHTDDSTCFYHADSETLVSGDAVVTLDGRAWFNPEFVEADVARSTEERLRSLPVRHLLPGHGEPIAATDVWQTARSFTTPPDGSGLLSRCSRRFGKWAIS